MRRGWQATVKHLKSDTGLYLEDARARGGAHIIERMHSSGIDTRVFSFAARRSSLPFFLSPRRPWWLKPIQTLSTHFHNDRGLEWCGDLGMCPPTPRRRGVLPVTQSRLTSASEHHVSVARFHHHMHLLRQPQAQLTLMLSISTKPPSTALLLVGGAASCFLLLALLLWVESLVST